jgi:hypothetical protein
MVTHTAHRAVLACSLFLHAGYIGAATVAAGMIQLLAGEASGLSALALIFFGGLLATASWRRARIVVERVDRARAATARPQRSDLPGPFTGAHVQLPHRAELG